jgi:hypothetical protein
MKCKNVSFDVGHSGKVIIKDVMRVGIQLSNYCEFRISSVQ